MIAQTLLPKLRDIFAHLYPDTINAQRIVNDAGINSMRISFSAQSINTWHNILVEAEKVNKLDDIFSVAQTEYPDNLDLQSVLADYQKLIIQEGQKQSGSRQAVAFRINLEPWVYLLQRNPEFADSLLRQEDFTNKDKIFRTLEDFLQASFALGLSAEVYSNRYQSLEKMASSHEFWTAALSALVLDFENNGPMKWLIKETIKALRKDRVTSDSTLGKVWEYIFQKYCNHLSKYHSSKVLDEISTALIALIEERKKDRDDTLYRFSTFLFNHLESDTLSIQQFANHLESYDRQLGNNAPPSFLETLKRLVGTAIAIAVHGVGDIPRFSPEMVTVPKTTLCNYEFQSMVCPLTVYDYSTIRGVIPRQVGDNPKLPYTFRIVSKNQGTLFNLLASEVLSIVRLCEQFEGDSQYSWDVPTVCEWLTLSGCETYPYPWGDTPPTPSQANLVFGRVVNSKIRPVGTYPLGTSKYGAQDCCGNVHEIVRISEDNRFPGDFRLAGGCYQTSALLSSCHIFRRLKTKKEDNRRNVSARLIRYRKQDIQKRILAMRRFEESNHPAIVYLKIKKV